MVDLARKSNFKRNIFVLIVVLLVLGGAIFGGGHLYRKYEPGRLAKKARGLMESGEDAQAGLTLRRALAINPNDVASLSTLAELADKHHDPTAVAIRVKLVSIQPESAAARIACAETALQYNQPAEAKSALDYGNPQAVAKDAPRFHELAGRTASALREHDAAVAHAAAALRAVPQNETYELDHAKALLDRGWLEDRAGARATLVRLAKSPAVQVPALRALIGDMTANSEFSGALEYARQLAAAPGAEFPDHLTLLDLLRRNRSDDFASALAAAKTAAQSNAQRAATLLIWMNQNGQAADAIAWFDSLPHEAWADTRVSAAAALCSLTAKNWPLVETLAQGNWGNLEFVRLALLARTLREQGKVAESARDWDLAIVAAKKQPGAPNMLIKWVADWGFTPAELDPLQAAAVADPRTDLDLVKSLLPRLGERKDTRALWQAVSRFYTANPSNDAAGNNLAMYSLLLRENVTSAALIAEELYQKHPQDARYVSTYAYALHQRGESDKALKVLETLPAADLERPEVAAYYGVILAATRNREKAAHFLELAQQADLLPEERRLVEQAR